MAENKLNSLSTRWNFYDAKKYFGIPDYFIQVFEYLVYKNKKEKDITEKSRIISNYDYCNARNIIAYINSDDSFMTIFKYVAQSLDEIKEYLSRNMDATDWEYLDTETNPINYYISQKNPPNIIVMRNIKTKKAVLITQEGFTNEHYKRTLAVITYLMPWFFELNEDSKKFFLLIEKENISSISKIMDEFYDDSNMREKFIKEKLCGFESHIKEKLLRATEDDIANCYLKIEDYTKILNEAMESLGELNYKLEAYSLLGSSDEICTEFFINHKNIDNYIIIDDTIVFTINDFIEYVDEDAFKTMFETEGSYFYKDESMSQFFYEIFINHKGKIQVKSEFESRGLRTLSPVKSGSSYFNSKIYKDVMPHPHLCYYACLGGNQAPITKYLSNGNWDMAIEQAIGATKNINLSDSTVMRAMIRFVKGSNDRFILADNGKKMNVTEFMKYVTEGE